MRGEELGVLGLGWSAGFSISKDERREENAFLLFLW